nr:PREDICTED: ras-associated and pleckstrin homology domains-containing protein 1-like [Lepisosteus oculatus]
MKRGTLNSIWGRKNNNLFGTHVEIKERENVELVLDSAAFPESGTAKVRARPTVKHISSGSTHACSEVVQGFAVPTPKVPPAVIQPGITAKENGAKSNSYSNGIVAEFPDMEETIYIPPPPAMAPPPPPPISQPIPPPLEFANDPAPSPSVAVSSPNLDLASLCPPPMAPPSPPKQFFKKDPDIAPFKPPPPMAPPKPPSGKSHKNLQQTSSSAYRNPNFSEDYTPQHPHFSPPPPPPLSQKQPSHVGPQPAPSVPAKTHKMPPPKPMRNSSMPNQDMPPQQPAPAPPLQKSMPSSFNPQNAAKLYNPESTAQPGSKSEREQKGKSIIFLQDTITDHLPTQVNGKDSSTVEHSNSCPPEVSPVPPAKPARRNSSGIQLEKDLKEFKDKIQTPASSDLSNPTARMDEVDVPLVASMDVDTPTYLSKTALPTLVLKRDVVWDEDTPKPAFTQNSLEQSSSEPQQQASPGKSRKQSPYISRTPYSLRVSEVLSGSGASQKDRSKSPMDLLLAAKQRNQNRSSLSIQSSNNNSSNISSSVSIHQSESSPNSFTVVPKSSGRETTLGTPISSSYKPFDPEPSMSPLTIPAVRSETPAVILQPIKKVQSSELLQSEECASTDVVQRLLHSPKHAPSSTLMVDLLEKHDTESPVPSPSVRDEENGEDLFIPFIPPPPEFANSDTEEESIPAPKKPPPSLPPSTPIQQKSNLILSSSEKVSTPAATIVNKTKGPPPPPKPVLKSMGLPRFPASNTSLKAAVQTQQKAPMQVPAKQNKPPPPPNPVLKPAPTPSQMTLQSILQKKMLEMDLKPTFQEVDTNPDEWGTSQSDDESSHPVKPKSQQKDKNANSQVKQSQGQDLRTKNELASKVKKPMASPTSTRPDTSGLDKSKQAYGMTFTVRPGTKQPITPVSKGESM